MNLPPVTPATQDYTNHGFQGDEEDDEASVIKEKTMAIKSEPPHIRSPQTLTEIKQKLNPENYTSIYMHSRLLSVPQSAGGGDGLHNTDHSLVPSDTVEDEFEIPTVMVNGLTSFPLVVDDMDHESAPVGHSTPRTHHVKKGWHNQMESQPMTHDKTKSSPAVTNHAPSSHTQSNGNIPRSYNLRSLGSRGEEPDELDIVTRVMQPGSSSEPLVRSLREELERMAQSNAVNPARNIDIVA